MLSLWLKSVFDGRNSSDRCFLPLALGGEMNSFWLSKTTKHGRVGQNANCQGFRTVADWIDKQYLPRNRSRLKAAHSYLTGELQGLDVPYVDRPAAMFVWADLRKVGQGGWDFSSYLTERCHTLCFCFGSTSRSPRLRTSCVFGGISSNTRWFWAAVRPSPAPCRAGSASSSLIRTTALGSVSDAQILDSALWYLLLVFFTDWLLYFLRHEEN